MPSYQYTDSHNKEKMASWQAVFHYTWWTPQMSFHQVVNLWLEYMVMDLQCYYYHRWHLHIIDAETSSNFWCKVCHSMSNIVSPWKLIWGLAKCSETFSRSPWDQCPFSVYCSARTHPMREDNTNWALFLVIRSCSHVIRCSRTYWRLGLSPCPDHQWPLLLRKLTHD